MQPIGSTIGLVKEESPKSNTFLVSLSQWSNNQKHLMKLLANSREMQTKFGNWANAHYVEPKLAKIHP